MTRMKNFSNQQTPSIIDTEYERCNFFQDQPVDSGGGVMVGVRLFPGDNTPRVFRECNLVNCEVPPGSTVDGGNTAIIVRSVVASTDTIIIDGQSIDVEHHSNFVHGKWTPSGYEYKPAPEEIKVD